MNKICNILIIKWLCLTVLLAAECHLAHAQTLPTNYYHALHFREANNIDSAMFYLNKSPNDVQCVLLKADIYYDEQDYASALKLYRQCADEGNDAALLKIATLFADMGFAEEALAWLQRYYDSGNVLIYKELLKIPAYENIIYSREWKDFWQRRHYNRKYDLIAEAEYQVATGNFYDAISMLQTLNGGTKQYLCDFVMAKAYLAAGNVDAATEKIDAAIAAKHDFTDALRLKINMTTEKPAVAYQLSRQLLKIEPFNPENLLIVAEHAYQSGDFAAVADNIRIYRNCFPQRYEAIVLEIKNLIATNEKYKALEMLSNALANDASKTELFTLRADVYYDFEMWRFAANDYSMALDIDPFNSEVYLKYGNCMFMLHDDYLACHAWQKAADMKNKEAIKNLLKHCK